jgi:hypothetical protein
MLKQYAREGMRGSEREKRWYGFRYLALIMNGHECGSVATPKRPSLNGVLLDSKTVYVRVSKRLERKNERLAGLAPDTVISVRSERTVHDSEGYIAFYQWVNLSQEKNLN